LIIPAAAIPTVEDKDKDVIRLHIGQEEPELLIEDMDRAFGTMK
jgi:cystathionine beta-lyase/cystathionine gamma-synthase